MADVEYIGFHNLVIWNFSEFGFQFNQQFGRSIFAPVYALEASSSIDV
jgi:hypothetical protein